MKKNITKILVIAMSISLLSACQKEDKKDDATNNVVTESPSNDNENSNTEDNNTDNTDSADDTNDTADTEDTNAPEAAENDLIQMIDKLYEIKDPGLMIMNSMLDLSNKDMVKYNTGLDDATKLKEVAVSETMIGSQAYSLVLVRVNDAADTETVANGILEGINPAKWICVTADDLKVVTKDDVVMLIMVSTTFADTVTSDQIVDAFKEISGGELDLELEK